MRYKFKLIQAPHPTWLTSVKRWSDGTLEKVNTSWVSKCHWSCTRMDTVLRMREALDAFYKDLGLDNPFMVSTEDIFKQKEPAKPVKPTTFDWSRDQGYVPPDICRTCVH